ncbi:DUF6777 domain-containing protein [Streptomyces sp. NPDC005485]|uniref:DUF6777 domain-containing protein n=1 Tax=Streptomyces sp. NPDC005485 TaxID=3155591 RepID=UPI0033ABA2E5
MTMRSGMQRAGISIARRTALLAIFALVIAGINGCTSDQMFAVRAVAANVSSLAPFFDESKGLGKDVTGLQPDTPSGVQASNLPGLYGGTEEQPVDGSSGDGNGQGNGEDDDSTGVFGGSTKPGTCLVTKLRKFLTDPGNSAKAREWAKVLDIRQDQIGKYIDKLTPVVLRHDTLVQNHDFKGGKSVSYDSLLQAGIAILVDQQGLPAVKCSCGNPLRPFTHSADKISVKFEHGNKKWKSYKPHDAMVVQAPPGDAKVDRLQLIDVQNPDTVIARDAGMDTEDETFQKDAPRTVPAVTQQRYADAANALAAEGLTPAYEGEQPADDAIVTGSNPPEGTDRTWGESVTLLVASQSPTPTESTTGPTTAGPTSPTTSPTTVDPTSPTTSPTTVDPTSPTTSPTTVDPTSPTTGGSSTGGSDDGGTGGLPTDNISASASEATSPEPTLSESPTSSEVVSAEPGISDTAPGEPTSGESSVSTA